MNILRHLLTTFACTALVAFTHPAVAAPGDVEVGFAPNVNGTVECIAVQPDGAIVIGSTHRILPRPGLPSPVLFHLIRLLPDGSIDPSFVPEVNGPVSCLGVQADGKILIGGGFSKVNGVAVSRIARLNPDGSLDSFAVSTDSGVSSLLVQPDGKILIGGRFISTVNGTAVQRVARLNADGSLDTSFSPSNPGFDVLEVTEDGAILTADQLVLKSFTSDGTLIDSIGFALPFGQFGRVLGAARQPDGRLLAWGANLHVGFNGPGGSLLRLQADWTYDSSFSPASLGELVDRVAPQADGKVLAFSFGATRLEADGSIDASFTRTTLTQSHGVNFPDYVEAVAVQADGRILLGGPFTAVNGQPRNSLARLENDAATQSLTVPDSTRVQWLRGGASPETQQVRFEMSTDGGMTWSALGAGSRIAGGWELSGLNLPTDAQVRGRARIGGSLLEAFAPSPAATLAPTLITPAVGKASGNLSIVAFSLPEDAQAGSVTLSFAKGGTTPRVLTLAGSQEGAGAHSFTFSPSDPTAAPEVVSITGGTNIPEGVYTVTFSYQDADGNPPAAATAVSVVVDLSPPMIGGTFSPLTLTTRADSGGVFGGVGTATLPDYTGQAVTSDDIAVARVTQAPLAGALQPVGTTQVTLTAHDTAGNTASTSFDVTVNDGTPPTIGGVFSPLTLFAGLAGAAALPDYTTQATTSDNVGVTQITQSPPAGSPQGIGSTVVTLTAYDAAGNSASKSFGVTVISDLTPPTVGSPGDGFAPLVLYAPQSGTVALPDYAAQAVSDDPQALITQEPVAGAPVEKGIVTVTIKATDLAGNQGTESFDVTVLVTGTAALAGKRSAVPNDAGDPRIPSGATWATFGVPSISMNGTIAGWMATVKVPPRGSFQGIFNGPPTQPALVLKTGEPATDAAGVPVMGVRFKSFREPVFASDDFAVAATVQGAHVGAGNDTGLWVGESGTLKEIAREGAAAPGAEPAKFKAFTSLAMPAPGTVFFTAKLAAPAAKDMGLWMWTAATGTQLVLLEGAFVNTGAGPVALKTFQALTSVKGSFGHGRYDADVPALDVRLSFADPDRTTAISTVAADGSVQVTRRSSQTDVDGRVPVSFGVPSSPGQGLGATAVTTFAPDAARGITPTSMVTIYDYEQGLILAQQSMAAPGAGTATFKSFLDPVAGFGFDGGRVQFFAATLAGAARSGDSGLWAFTSSLALVAREGAEPPGAAGTKWKGFTSLSVLDGRGPMFTAKLASGTAKVTTKNDAGLWATDSTGALRLILREGDTLPGGTLKSFTLLGAVAGSPGQRRAWTSGDASARVIYRAFFTDGTSAIVSTALP